MTAMKFRCQHTYFDSKWSCLLGQSSLRGKSEGSGEFADSFDVECVAAAGAEACGVDAVSEQ